MTGAGAALIPLALPDAAQFSWTQEGPALRVMSALEAAEAGGARFVGGCVRDSLLGVAPHDVDIATRLTPDQTIAALKAAGLGAAPTGIEHGTVTAIADHVGVEVTSLRADVATDGRRAVVAFTRDWALDAQRRDFTMNALYLTADQKLYDPVGGLDDLRAGRVRFIGAAETRIREDYLRILRFFRFSARVSSNFDAVGLAACAALTDGIASLSAERVGDELSKILRLETALTALEAMVESGVLHAIWPAAPDLAAFARLKELAADAPAPLGLAALYGADDARRAAAANIDRHLRFSNADARRRKMALAGAERLHASMDDRQARAALFEIAQPGAGETPLGGAGGGSWGDAWLVAAARGGGELKAWRQLGDLPTRWTPPLFPFSGKHVLDAGVAPGPKVADVLHATRAQWVAEDFPSRGRLDEIFAEQIAKHH